jgi:hypothetical protein
LQGFRAFRRGSRQESRQLASLCASTSTAIVAGPASFLLRNRTQTASVFLETGSPHDTATVATGFEWLAFDPPLDIELEHGEILYGLVDTGVR